MVSRTGIDKRAKNARHCGRVPPSFGRSTPDSVFQAPAPVAPLSCPQPLHRPAARARCASLPSAPVAPLSCPRPPEKKIGEFLATLDGRTQLNALMKAIAAVRGENEAILRNRLPPHVA